MALRFLLVKAETFADNNDVSASQQWELRQSDLDCSPEYFNCVLLSRLALCIFIAIIFCRVTFVILSFVSFGCLSGFYVQLSSLFEYGRDLGENVIRICKGNY